ncbi:MAG: hypothetical protein K5840_01880 [Eubacterium sp.]|nr:hypothetical protein [Eubacterium sp.]
MKGGDTLVITNYIALEGTSLLVRDNRERLDGRFPLYMTQRILELAGAADTVRSAEIASSLGAFVHSLEGESFFKGLWLSLEELGVGLEADMEEVPIRQETVEISEILEADPYELPSGGSLLVYTSRAAEFIDLCGKEGIRATAIGYTTGKKARTLRNGDHVRYLDKWRERP